MGAYDAGVGKRWSGFLDVGNVLCVSCAGIPVVWAVDVGYVTTHWEDLGRILPQGGP